MKIFLAGYNIDVDILSEVPQLKQREDLTPETLSAAYARISRNPKPVNELRAIARKEVTQARQSNRNIIFTMGHHSVAEHAIFNFDIIDVSRLALEAIEHFRLASYTEKSQRYIKLKDAFVIPPEIKETTLERDYKKCIEAQNEGYKKLYQALKDSYLAQQQSKGSDKEMRRKARLFANEDARYVLSLATMGQLGVTMNARSFELLLRRFASSHLRELQEIGLKLYDLVSSIAPSIVLFTEANSYDRTVYDDLTRWVQEHSAMSPDHTQAPPEVTLIDATAQADKALIASLLHRVTNCSHEQCWHRAQDLSPGEMKELIMKAFQHVELYDTVLREFEFITLNWELIVSASCFAQFKRHRIASLSAQDYYPPLGVTIPRSFYEIGQDSYFQEIIQRSEDCYYALQQFDPHIAAYVLTNAHRRRIHFSCNLRELYHICRLREDQHAQWDIRNIAQQMNEKAQQMMPLATMFLCGKDTYPARYENFFGHPPKVISAELPGQEKISKQ